MANKPLPLPLWDRKAQRRIDEFMDDSPSTYESQPRRSFNQWLESHPLYDWLIAAYNDTHMSARKIAPFIRKHHIDMSEFEPVQYRSYAEFFDRRFREGVRPFARGCTENQARARSRSLLPRSSTDAFVATIKRGTGLGGPLGRLNRRHAPGVDGDRAALGRISGVQSGRAGCGASARGRRIVAVRGTLRRSVLLRPSGPCRDRRQCNR
jgi:hypothetical protein